MSSNTIKNVQWFGTISGCSYKFGQNKMNPKLYRGLVQQGLALKSLSQTTEANAAFAKSRFEQLYREGFYCA